MTRFSPLFLALLALPLACSSSTSKDTQNPDAPAADGEGPTRKPKAHGTIGARGANPMKGLAKRIKAKKPPRDPNAKPGHPAFPIKRGGKVAIESVVPTAASPGSLIQVFGTGFRADIAKNSVTIGKAKAEVVEAGGGRLVVKIPDGAKDGKIKVKAGKKSATSDVTFAVLSDDGGFGKPNLDVNHGLIANVYVIGKEVSELPAFDDLGEPTGTIAVDALDVPDAAFEQGLPGRDGRVAEHFGLHFQGSLNVVAGQEGEYSLCVNSDDGAILYLDQQGIVDNDGVHTAKEVCELVFLEPGEYQLDLLYFQGARGNAALQLTAAKDGGEKAALPASMLFPPAKK